MLLVSFELNKHTQNSLHNHTSFTLKMEKHYTKDGAELFYM